MTVEKHYLDQYDSGDPANHYEGNELTKEQNISHISNYLNFWMLDECGIELLLI